MNSARTISLRVALTVLLMTGSAQWCLRAQTSASQYARLDTKSALNRESLQDVDVHAQAQIEKASDRAGEADQLADDAEIKAKLAQREADQSNTRVQMLETAVSHLDQYKTTNEIEIHFKPGHNNLPKNEALDKMATTLKARRGYLIEVKAFSSGKGRLAMSNSRKIADAVLRYLVVNHAIPIYRISIVCLGNTQFESVHGNDHAKENSGDKLVIRLMKNDL